MGMVHVEINEPGGGYVDWDKVDATTDAEIAMQMAEDDSDPRNFTPVSSAGEIRRLRQSLQLSQSEFARCIDVPIQTIRNWEQGKRMPTGAARTLIKILTHDPTLVAWLAT